MTALEHSLLFTLYTFVPCPYLLWSIFAVVHICCGPYLLWSYVFTHTTDVSVTKTASSWIFFNHIKQTNSKR